MFDREGREERSILRLIGPLGCSPYKYLYIYKQKYKYKYISLNMGMILEVCSVIGYTYLSRFNLHFSPLRKEQFVLLPN